MDLSQLPPGAVLDAPPQGAVLDSPSPSAPGGGTAQAMEAALRAQWPNIKVTSEGRSKSHNASVGGAPNSYHLDDMAIDFVGGPSRDEAVNYLNDRGWHLDEHLDEGDHVHLAASGFPAPPEGAVLDQPDVAPKADQPVAPDLKRDAYVETIQNMFDHGFPAEAMQSYAKGVGAPPIDEKRLSDAIAYRDRGGKNQKFELKPDGSTSIAGAPDLNDTGSLGAAGLSLADSATAGVLHRISAAGIALGAGADRNDPSIWNGHSFSDAYDENLKRSLAMEDKTAAEHPTATAVGSLAGAAVPIVPGLGAARGFGLGLKSARLAKVAKAATKGAQVGAVYGGANAAGHTYTGDPADYATNAAVGAGEGAATGAVLAPVAEGAIALAPKVINKLSPTNRFVSRQAAKNPHAAYDAGIAEDLSDLPNRVSSPIDPKGRAKVTVKEVNALGRSYSTGMKEQINALDLPKARKAELSRAMTDWLTMSDDQIANLRSDVPGNAIADAIVATKRLYKLTPEVKPRGGLGEAMDAVGTIGGTMLDGVTGGLAGSTVGRLARRMMFRPADAEAARVNSAERIIKRSKAYSKLQSEVGPSPRAQSQKDLQDLYDTTVSGREDAAVAAQQAKADAKAAKEAAPPAPPKSANAAMIKLMQASNQPPSVPQAPKAAQAGLQRILQAANAPLAPEAPLPLKMAPKSAQAGLMRIMQADTTPPVPKSSPLPKVKALAPEQQAIEDNIKAGIPGDSQVQNYLANRVGVDVKTTMKALDTVAGKYPQLSGDITRIKMGYPTLTKRGVMDSLVPAMKQTTVVKNALAKLEAAEAAKTTTTKVKASAAKVTQPKPTEGGPVLRRIDRETQWQQGKDRIVAEANRRIRTANTDTSLSTVALRQLNDLEHVRDNFKTAEAAKAYIQEHIAPKVAKLPDGDKVINYYNRVAEAKPYQTEADYERGTKARRK